MSKRAFHSSLRQSPASRAPNRDVCCFGLLFFQEIREAALDGDTPGLREIVGKGVDLKAYRGTPRWSTTWVRVPRSSGLLILVLSSSRSERRSNLVQESNGFSCLHLAAVGGNLETVAYLVDDAGCDVNAKDEVCLLP